VKMTSVTHNGDLAHRKAHAAEKEFGMPVAAEEP